MADDLREVPVDEGLSAEQGHGLGAVLVPHQGEEIRGFVDGAEAEHQDIGETAAECAVRECLEETGIIAELTGFLGVYTNPNHIVAYTDGEIRQQYENTYIRRPVGGVPTINDEADGVRFVQPADLDQYDIHPSMRQQIKDPRRHLPLPRLSRHGCFHSLHGGEDLRGRPADEPPDHAVVPVAAADLRDPVLRGGSVAVRRGRHVAVHEGVHQQRLLQQGELSREILAQTALLGFQEREGVVCDQPRQPLVGAVFVTKEPGPVQRMEAGRCEPGCVADVVKCGGSEERVSVCAEDLTYFDRALSHPLGMCPSSWKRTAEFGFRQLLRPLVDPITHAVIFARRASCSSLR
ncbi:hypothetical protein SBADM41S_10023 [Streptomyces badius]